MNIFFIASEYQLKAFKKFSKVATKFYAWHAKVLLSLFLFVNYTIKKPNHYVKKHFAYLVVKGIIKVIKGINGINQDEESE